MSATVRAATEDDIFDLLVLAREFSREATTMHKWDKDKTEAMLLNSIRSEGTCVFILVDDEGIVQGGLVGTLTEPFMSLFSLFSFLAFLTLLPLGSTFGKG